MYCAKCGKEMNDQAIMCVGCGCPTTNGRIALLGPDVKSVGLNVLCFFFWYVGLILYIVWKKDYPIKAKSCGKWSLIGVCVYVGFVILYMVFMFAMMGLIMGGVSDTFQSFN